MASRRSVHTMGTGTDLRRVEAFAELSLRILRHAIRGTSRIEFMRDLSKALLELSGCDAIEVRVHDPVLHYRCQAGGSPKGGFRFAVLPASRANKRPPQTAPDVTRRKHASLLSFPFTAYDNTAGLLMLKSSRKDYFTADKRRLYEDLADVLGLAISTRRAHWALRERVKELTCLYGIARVAQRPGLLIGQAFQEIVELLPPAWQFPQDARARISLDGRCWVTHGFQESEYCQRAGIQVAGTLRGAIDVVYTRSRREFAEGAFLKEEQGLIDTVARELALIVEQREAEAHKLQLHDQLRHADRLATIGQLSAGVAHELNEPLGSILGFAQLISKDPELTERPAQDVTKIIRAALHAREVIQKLLIFARQQSPEKIRVNLNQVVEDGLYFLESRCAKAGISLLRLIQPDVPEISADPSQLRQVLINLVVNAMQAMPEGGTLTVETHARRGHVALVVADTGIGMNDDVKSKIFTPFFTTKDIDQGTGLGLAVVHGIVSTHRGSIEVHSSPGSGSRFEIRFPLNREDERHDHGQV